MKSSTKLKKLNKLKKTDDGSTPERLKRGWKRDADGNAVSPEEWKKRFVIRAVVIPVASPEDFGKGSSDGWKKLRDQLKDAWIRSTEAANWALRRLLTNDVTRAPADLKCPKMPVIDLYRERNWKGWSGSAQAVLRTIKNDYESKRYQVVWTGGASLPNVRYPYPYPVRSTEWGLHENSEGGLWFEATLWAEPGVLNNRVSMRMKGGSEYRAQLVRARWLIENPHLRSEASIYKRGNQIVVKLVGWFPKIVDIESSGIMFVNTASESFLVGVNARDERLWIINGDRAKRWMTRSKFAMQRWHEDRKFEKRRTKRDARKYLEDMQASTLKNRNRLNSFIDESAAQVVNHAKRRRLAKIVFNDTCKEFFADFQWYHLALLIEQKCNAAGILFERISADESVSVESMASSPA